MRNIIIFCVFCIIGGVWAAPTADDVDKNIVLTRSFFNESFVKYKAKHDIVEILVPIVYRIDMLSLYNYTLSERNIEYEERFMKDITIFFVEADIQNGKRVDQGLYVLKNGQAKNILPTGRTIAATSDNKYIFFGASDGLFAYNYVTNSAIKYGSITDGIISIAAANEAVYVVYILTEDHKLYNVSNNFTTKDLISDVKDAQEIVLDNYHNIYYYNSKKEVFVRTPKGVIQIRDLPSSPKSLKLIRPQYVMDGGVPIILNDSIYHVYVNGTSKLANQQFSSDAIPTAFAVEAIYIQYYAFNKKIYEYKFLHPKA